MPTYSDINFSLDLTQYGDITIVNDIESVQQSLVNIILTKKGSKSIYQNPEFGSNVHTLLFEKINNITSLQIKNEITSAIENFEPRVKIIKVSVNANADDKTYEINIEYELVNLSITDQLNLNLGIIK